MNKKIKKNFQKSIDKLKNLCYNKDVIKRREYKKMKEIYKVKIEAEKKEYTKKTESKDLPRR